MLADMTNAFAPTYQAQAGIENDLGEGLLAIAIARHRADRKPTAQEHEAGHDRATRRHGDPLHCGTMKELRTGANFRWPEPPIRHRHTLEKQSHPG